MEELEKITKNKDVSLKARVKVIHTLMSPFTVYRCESWTMKKVEGVKSISLKDSFGGELSGYPRPPERQPSGS